MWEAIKYVTSGITLAAFVVAVAAWLYRSKILEREKLIRSASEEERPQLVERTLEIWHVETSGLTREQKYNLVLEQIRRKAERFKTIARVIFGIAALIAVVVVLAILLVPTPPRNVNIDGNVNTNRRPSPSPTNSPEVIITTPRPNDALVVETDNGAATIPVTGMLKGSSELSNVSVYIFTNTGGSEEWWYHDPTIPKKDGNWRANGLVGSDKQPVKADQTVTILAVVATDADIATATKNSGGEKKVEDFGLFTSAIISKEQTVTITPKKKS
jgi:hypothetical protein